MFGVVPAIMPVGAGQYQLCFYSVQVENTCISLDTSQKDLRQIGLKVFRSSAILHLNSVLLLFEYRLLPLRLALRLCKSKLRNLILLK